MKIFLASAGSDWGGIFMDERIKASSFPTAFNRAAKLAKIRGRKRPKQMTITLRNLGEEHEKANGKS